MRIVIVVGPPLGGFLFSNISLEAPYLFCAVISLLDLLLRLWVRPEGATKTHSIESTRVDSEAQQPLLTDTDSIPDSVDISHKPSVTLWSLLTDFQFFITFIGIALEAGVYCGLELVLTLHLSHYFHYTPMEIGWFYMAVVVPDAVAAMIIGPVSDTWGRKNIVALGLIVYGATLVMLPLAYDTLTLVVALVAYGVAAAIAITPSSPEVAEIVESQGGGGYGRVYALYNMGYSLGMLAGPSAAGWLYGEYGFTTCMWIFAIILWSYSPVVWAAWFLGHSARHEE